MLSSLKKNTPTGSTCSLAAATLHRCKRHAPRVLAIVAALASFPATAEISDTIHPFASLSYSYDDNLFRLPDAVPGDNSPRSDTSKQLVAGVALERPIGRQRITADARVSKVSFSRFNQIDYNGKNADVTWFWQFGNHWNGTAGLTYAQTLTPFSDFHSSQRNLRTQRSEFADANWQFHPSWRVHGRVAQTKFDYELASQKFLDRKEDNSELGFDYLVPSGSTVGLVARHIKGDYPNQLAFGPVIVNDSYTQDELKLKVFWLLTPLTQLEFQGGRAKRSHGSSSLRDASGTNGRLNVNWAPSQLLHVTGSAWREFAPYEGSGAAYSLNKGSSVAVSWSPIEKIRIDSKLQYIKRDFSLALFNGAQGFQDSNRNASLGVNYALRKYLVLDFTLLHDSRKVGQNFSGSYRGNGASISANLQF